LTKTTAAKKRAIVPDVSAAPRAPVESRVPRVLVGATFVTGVASRAQLPAPGAAEIAFAGRSNAGKSSAINALANRTRLAYASRTPGRTQQINLFALRSGAIVADLPGYGYAAVAKDIKQVWQDFLWDYVSTRDTLIGLVLVVDARHGLRPLDFVVLDGFVPSGRPVLVLATKSDKLNRADQASAARSMRNALAERYPAHASLLVVVPFSATRRVGLIEADDVIAGWLDLPPAPERANAAARTSQIDDSSHEETKKRPRSQGE
jgi:GTP-binding protein